MTISDKTAALGVFVIIVGCAVIGIAAATPWHTDSDAYFTGLDAIRRGLYDGSPDIADFRAASDSFYALQDRFETNKWVYADLGYSTFVLGCALIGAALIWRYRSPWRGTRKLVVILSVSAAAVGLVTVGTIASGIQEMGRQRVPEWADSIGIVLFGAIGVAPILAMIVAAFAILPRMITSRQPSDLLVLKGPGWWHFLLSAVVYLPGIVVALLLMASYPFAGGWAIWPAGALLLWLMLNARATWLGDRPIQALP